jgi:hypothetical protein
MKNVALKIFLHHLQPLRMNTLALREEDPPRHMREPCPESD